MNEAKFVVFGVVSFLAIILLIILSPIGFVGVGERGVKIRLGAVTGDVVGEGIYFRVPLVESVKNMDIKVQKEEADVSAASKDLQTVTSKVALNYHLDPKSVASIYQNIGSDYKARLIDPSVQESVKATTAKFTAEELITKREQVREDIKIELRDKFSTSGIIVDEINIVDFDFSDSFNAAIEAKVTAEQTALAARNKLEQVKFEAQQQIETAKAQAETIRIQAQAINAQGGTDYVNLKAIEKWNGVLPTQMVPGSTVPFINLTK